MNILDPIVTHCIKKYSDNVIFDPTGIVINKLQCLIIMLQSAGFEVVDISEGDSIPCCRVSIELTCNRGPRDVATAPIPEVQISHVAMYWNTMYGINNIAYLRESIKGRLVLTAKMWSDDTNTPGTN